MTLPRYLTLADAAHLLGGNQWLAELLEARGELGAVVSGYAQEWTDRVETARLREYLIKHHGRDLLSDEGNQKKTVDKGFTTTERNTLLTIIAALCDYSAIKPDDRGAASQIAKLTEEIGAAVSDDTVRRVLAKIPDALETRMK